MELKSAITTEYFSLFDAESRFSDNLDKNDKALRRSEEHASMISSDNNGPDTINVTCNNELRLPMPINMHKNDVNPDIDSALKDFEIYSKSTRNTADKAEFQIETKLQHRDLHSQLPRTAKINEPISENCVALLPHFYMHGPYISSQNIHPYVSCPPINQQNSGNPFVFSHSIPYLYTYTQGAYQHVSCNSHDKLPHLPQLSPTNHQPFQPQNNQPVNQHYVPVITRSNIHLKASKLPTVIPKEHTIHYKGMQKIAPKKTTTNSLPLPHVVYSSSGKTLAPSKTVVNKPLYTSNPTDVQNERQRTVEQVSLDLSKKQSCTDSAHPKKSKKQQTKTGRARKVKSQKHPPHPKPFNEENVKNIDNKDLSCNSLPKETQNQELEDSLFDLLDDDFFNSLQEEDEQQKRNRDLMMADFFRPSDYQCLGLNDVVNTTESELKAMELEAIKLIKEKLMCETSPMYRPCVTKHKNNTTDIKENENKMGNQIPTYSHTKLTNGAASHSPPSYLNKGCHKEMVGLHDPNVYLSESWENSSSVDSEDNSLYDVRRRIMRENPNSKHNMRMRKRSLHQVKTSTRGRTAISPSVTCSDTDNENKQRVRDNTETVPVHRPKCCGELETETTVTITTNASKETTTVVTASKPTATVANVATRATAAKTAGKETTTETKISRETIPRTKSRGAITAATTSKATTIVSRISSIPAVTAETGETTSRAARKSAICRVTTPTSTTTSTTTATTSTTTTETTTSRATRETTTCQATIETSRISAKPLTITEATMSRATEGSTSCRVTAPTATTTTITGATTCIATAKITTKVEAATFRVTTLKAATTSSTVTSSTSTAIAPNLKKRQLQESSTSEGEDEVPLAELKSAKKLRKTKSARYTAIAARTKRTANSRNMKKVVSNKPKITLEMDESLRLVYWDSFHDRLIVRHDGKENVVGCRQKIRIVKLRDVTGKPREKCIVRRKSMAKQTKWIPRPDISMSRRVIIPPKLERRVCRQNNSLGKTVVKSKQTLVSPHISKGNTNVRRINVQKTDDGGNECLSESTLKSSDIDTNNNFPVGTVSYHTQQPQQYLQQLKHHPQCLVTQHELQQPRYYHNYQLQQKQQKNENASEECHEFLHFINSNNFWNAATRV